MKERIKKLILDKKCPIHQLIRMYFETKEFNSYGLEVLANYLADIFEQEIAQLKSDLEDYKVALELACEKVDFVEETCVYRDKSAQELSEIIYGNQIGESKYTPNSEISFPNGFGKNKVDFCSIDGCNECYKHYFLHQAKAQREGEEDD